MTMSEVEVDRITQQVFAARNSGLDAALVKVVIDAIEKATEEQAANLSILVDEWMAQTADGRGFRVDHWRGQDYTEGLEAGREECALALRAALGGGS